MKPTLFTRLTASLKPRPALSPDMQRAQSLIAAIDAGGIPLNPAKVNDIARKVGLDVSTKAPMDETIQRIRGVLARV
jgi:hypothetical protein